jgi:copper ion binding protein
MITREYSVPDISCDHCVNAITEELSKIEGVRNVDVNLAEKVVKVEADDSVADHELREGIEEAGYDITS